MGLTGYEKKNIKCDETATDAHRTLHIWHVTRHKHIVYNLQGEFTITYH